MVNRVFVEKKEAFKSKDMELKNELKDFLGIKSVEKVRIIIRYDVENLPKEVFKQIKTTVFGEMPVDNVYEVLNPLDAYVLAVEYLPGQFDIRANGAKECISLLGYSEVKVKTAVLYLVYGKLTKDDKDKIKKYMINPVEARESSLDLPKTLEDNFIIPKKVETLDGFKELSREDLEKKLKDLGLAMDIDDLRFCQEYFKAEKRNPTITEIRMIDTYWSDHCRHTTFLTEIVDATFEDKEIEETFNEYKRNREEIGDKKPITLMDLATISGKTLFKRGKLENLDVSEEINACTVKTKVNINGVEEDWLILFKNETHNHPTEIEPFGGAATCIGGAIRDPLSGRAYVYGAMRVTGSKDPRGSMEETLKGKLPQRKIVTTAAKGYSSYGNQIGLATGLVNEIYHDGYEAKRMEIGAVIAAAPEKNVKREVPKPGDVVILLGGRTGRDGIGGATGSSKSHTEESVNVCGAEVQKGNATEERKLQRLFRDSRFTTLVKRCNDFGAGGVSVAIGELADGLVINLDAVPKKYQGLDGTELAISESQERMAIVVDKNDVNKVLELAREENILGTEVAYVTEEPRLKMYWNNEVIVDISRGFLNSNGASKSTRVICEKTKDYSKEIVGNFHDNLKKVVSDINCCSQRGLTSQFDSTIGAGTILMPLGGKYQRTPIQSMAHLIPVEKGETNDATLMSYGFNPYIMEKDPYKGAYLSVIESISKLVAEGSSLEEAYLTFQEYFPSPKGEAKGFGAPLMALLGAYKAQMDYEIASIGGKDSMSGTFENIKVPPTLVSFAVSKDKADYIVSPEFKKTGNKIVLIEPKYSNGLPKVDSLKEVFKTVHSLIKNKKCLSAYTITQGGIAEAIFKMSIGNEIGANLYNVDLKELFSYKYGAFVLEILGESKLGKEIGETTNEKVISYENEKIELKELLTLYNGQLEEIFTTKVKEQKPFNNIENKPSSIKLNGVPLLSKPKVLIPVFPGTNCEVDTYKAFEYAGANPELYIIKNITPDLIKISAKEFASKIRESQIIFIPGGFSAGDEPDGSGKFISSFFRNEVIKDEVHNLLKNRNGLMGGICNGFQGLIKLGLVTTGEIVDLTEDMPTLTYNVIGKHQSQIVYTRIENNSSPWLRKKKVGEIVAVPISHGEGRFVANEKWQKLLVERGQIATRYVDLNKVPTMDIDYNPNGSVLAIEGITSPDGRVFGKMGHSERIGKYLYKNIYGNMDIEMFKSAVEFYK